MTRRNLGHVSADQKLGRKGGGLGDQLQALQSQLAAAGDIDAIESILLHNTDATLVAGRYGQHVVVYDDDETYIVDVTGEVTPIDRDMALSADINVVDEAPESHDSIDPRSPGTMESWDVTYPQGEPPYLTTVDDVRYKHRKFEGFTGKQREWSPGDTFTAANGESAKVVRKEDEGGGVTGYVAKYTSGPAMGETFAVTPSAMLRSARTDKLPGGLADTKDPSDFDPAQLAQGIKVELEHVDDETLALEIAMDHLVEDPQYYTKLYRMEHDGERGHSLVDLTERGDAGSGSAPGVMDAYDRWSESYKSWNQYEDPMDKMGQTNPWKTPEMGPTAVPKMTTPEEPRWEAFKEWVAKRPRWFRSALGVDPEETSWEYIFTTFTGLPITDPRRKNIQEEFERDYMQNKRGMAMKQPEDLPEGSKVVIRDDIDGTTISIESPGGSPQGYISIQDGKVSDVNADPGWGPMLYEVAMEYVTEYGGTLTSDYNVSDEAANVWEKFMERRDVQRRPMPRKWTPVRYAPGEMEDSPDTKRTEEALKYEFSRAPSRTMRELEELDKLEFEAQLELSGPTVAVDLDGTLLAEIDYDQPWTPAGQPALSTPEKGAVSAMEMLEELGWTILIYTARFSQAESPEQVDAFRAEIDDHLQRYEMPYHDIVIGPKPVADVYIDNKAKKYDGDWYKVLRDISMQGHPEQTRADDDMQHDGVVLIDTEDDPNDWTNPTEHRRDLSVDPYGGRDQVKTGANWRRPVEERLKLGSALVKSLETRGYEVEPYGRHGTIARKKMAGGLVAASVDDKASRVRLTAYPVEGQAIPNSVSLMRQSDPLERLERDMEMRIQQVEQALRRTAPQSRYPPASRTQGPITQPTLEHDEYGQAMVRMPGGGGMSLPLFLDLVNRDKK